MTLGRAIDRTSTTLSLFIATLLLALFSTPMFRGWSMALIGAVTLALGLMVLSLALQTLFAVSLDLGPQLSILAYCAAFAIGSEMIERARRLRAERARSAARRDLIGRIVDVSSDGVMAIDSDGLIVICNSQVGRLFGCRVEEIQGRPIEGFLPVSIAPFFGEGASSEALPFTFEHTIAKADGEDAIVEAVVNKSMLHADSAEPVLVVTLRDVTARRRAEAAERQAIEERLVAARAKSLFIANMSHELRTPLNAIIGFSEILEFEAMGPLGNVKYKEYSAAVTKSGRHLLNMINAVLEVARLDSGQVQVNPSDIEMRDLVSAAFEVIRNGRDYEDQELTLQAVEIDDLIRLDSNLVRQVLVNLLSNAVKFAKPAQKNSVNVKIWEPAPQIMRVTIEDDGVGIAPGALSQISELFVQGDHSLTRRHEGSGLGLYLVKRHLALLGGTLTIESTEGQGTRVHVDFPRTQRAHKKAA